MFQSDTDKSLAAEERTGEARSFVRTVKELPGVSTPPRRGFASCWKASAGRLL